MDSRAVSPVVEKMLTIGLVALFVSGFGLALFGGVVPDYRARAADQIADRSLAAVTDAVEASVPTSPAAVRVTRTVTVPATIGGSTYRFELAGRRLHLRHPDPTLDATTRLAIPSGVDVANGSVAAGTVRIRLRGRAGNRTLEVEPG